MRIRNPILRGFHPDPSILRVGQDYYIATSTFEWWPGVRLHHSRDLVHWRPIGYALTRTSQLDMRGNPDSGGIWAPCLSHDGQQFYLIYTDVKTWGNAEAFKDTHNYLVTAPSIEGPWSEPVYLNSAGFDPSLFHDEDGRKWLVNMRWDHRKGKNAFSGIVLQEYDPVEQTLVGPIYPIFSGTPLGVTEGPHLYKKDGWYYLLVAEGGTVYQHAATVARSRRLEGPYEVDPLYPTLTAKDDPTLPLQKAGHASLVTTPQGDWYMAHLVGRPLEPPQAPRRHCPLGRETALQKIVWSPDGWPRLAQGGRAPSLEVEAPGLPPHPWPDEPEHDDFDTPSLSLHFQTLRLPPDPSWLSLRERPGYLRLYGRESLSSKHRQSLVARRLQHFYAEAQTALEFEPEDFQQMAGLVCYYDSGNWVYLRLSRDEQLGKTLAILTCENGHYDEPLGREIPIPDWPRVHLRVRYQREFFSFAYSPDGQRWQEIPQRFESYKLSDEHCRGLGFTGTFIGLCAQDLSGRRRHADFDYFIYRELEP